MAVDLRWDPAARTGALKRIGELGLNPETMRNWVQQAEVDDGRRPAVTPRRRSASPTSNATYASRVEGNEILHPTSTFLAAAELDRKLK